MFLLQILIRASMSIHYILEKNIFAVIVYKLSVQKKYQNAILKAALELVVDKRLYNA